MRVIDVSYATGSGKESMACWDDVPLVSDDYARARDAIRAHVAAMIEQMVALAKS